jgi:hypothetical protein
MVKSLSWRETAVGEGRKETEVQMEKGSPNMQNRRTSSA